MSYRLFATRPTGNKAITFNWNGKLQPGELIVTPDNRFPQGGNVAIVSGGSRTRAEQNIDGRINLNFRLGERLLYTNRPDSGSPLTVTFVQPVRKAGAQISAGMEAMVQEFEFIALVSIGTAAGDHEFAKVCISRTRRNGTASFVGVASDSTDEPIEWISFDVRKMPRTRREIRDYGINQLTVLKV